MIFKNIFYLFNKQFFFFFTEIKYRIFYIFLSILITFFVCYFYKEQLVFLLTKTLLYNMNSHRFIFTTLIEIFFSYIYFCIYFSIIINIPFNIVFIGHFFFNSLYIHEFKLFFNFLILVIFFYIISIFLNYFFILPNFLKLFLNFEQSNSYFPLHLEAKIDEILKILLKIFIYIILYFQIPVLILTLKFVNIIDEYFLIKYRKFFYFIFIIFSACIAPPEIIIQFIILFLILICFEFFLFIILFILFLKE
jgi:sec-independent protein translocase protein TatC